LKFVEIELNHSSYKW